MVNKNFLDQGGQLFGGHSYAQHGDDIMILSIFSRLGIATPSYLDIGASHPYIISNTALLYERGARGINVEADPDCLAEFHRYRPQDINLNCGVAAIPGRAALYFSQIAPNIYIKSFVRAFAESYGPISKTVDVQIRTINDIVDEYRKGIFPDLLNIDAEELDLEILSTLYFYSDYLPKVICAEVEHRNSGGIKRLLLANGYFLFGWAGANMFFVQERYRDKIYGDERAY